MVFTMPMSAVSVNKHVRVFAYLLALGLTGLNPSFRATALGKIPHSKHQIPNTFQNSKTNVPNRVGCQVVWDL